MNVYIVSVGQKWEGSFIEAVTTSKEKALNVADTIELGTTYDYVEVREYEVNEETGKVTSKYNDIYTRWGNE